ncbi:hypothetical protein JVU11DRAFT_9457 [Chiua virens]|nr:hypothetical protein JVU11DRAFT_9457 [Chiua virens]
MKMLNIVLTGQPCNINGVFLPDGTEPGSTLEKNCDDWTSYHRCLEFELTEFLFKQNQMPASQIDSFLIIWGVSLLQCSGEPLFTSHQDMYETIDNSLLGDICMVGEF